MWQSPEHLPAGKRPAARQWEFGAAHIPPCWLLWEGAGESCGGGGRREGARYGGAGLRSATRPVHAQSTVDRPHTQRRGIDGAFSSVSVLFLPKQEGRVLIPVCQPCSNLSVFYFTSADFDSAVWWCQCCLFKIMLLSVRAVRIQGTWRCHFPVVNWPWDQSTLARPLIAFMCNPPNTGWWGATRIAVITLSHLSDPSSGDCSTILISVLDMDYCAFWVQMAKLRVSEWNLLTGVCKDLQWKISFTIEEVKATSFASARCDCLS